MTNTSEVVGRGVLRHVVNVGIAALAQMAGRLTEVAQRLGNALRDDCR
jgi:hypothetical protein